MYLVSACLAGCNCRYDGSNNANERVIALVNAGKAVPVCPEQLGNLPTPRECSEIILDAHGRKRVFNNQGDDVTEAFERGAQRTLAICRALNIGQAILQSRSPSCGKGRVYDGTFSGVLVEGWGVTAELLHKNGICVRSELELELGGDPCD